MRTVAQFEGEIVEIFHTDTLSSFLFLCLWEPLFIINGQLCFHEWRDHKIVYSMVGRTEKFFLRPLANLNIGLGGWKRGEKRQFTYHFPQLFPHMFHTIWLTGAIFFHPLCIFIAEVLGMGKTIFWKVWDAIFSLFQHFHTLKSSNPITM